MKYSYFKTFSFLNSINELSSNELSERIFYYRFYYEKELSCNVGQRCHRGEFDLVFYTGNNLNNIQKFHLEHFPSIDSFNIIYQIEEFTVMVKKFNTDLHFLKAEMYNYNNNYEQIESFQFDKRFSLQEYRSRYMENGQSKQKVFLRYVWEIVDEE